MSTLQRFGAYTACFLSLAAGSATAYGATIVHQQPAPLVVASEAEALIKGGGIPLTSTTVADIAQSVAPAVVRIDANRPMPNYATIQGFPFDLFKQFQPPTPPRPTAPKSGAPQAQPPETIGPTDTGSGFIIRKDGYIVTNAHVIRGATKIKVTLNDKRVLDGTVVGADGFSDVAVVKLNTNDLPTVPMGSSHSLRPGEFCIAIGSPWGFDHSVSFGIISAVERSVTDMNGNINYIQTDAAINPGNSGGPLLNLAGEVIGVNTFIISRAQNIGFAIPIDVAKPVSQDLLENKKINRPWVGIAMADLDDAFLKGLGLPTTTKGVVVSGVVPKSPAQSAGFERGDIIEKIDGQKFRRVSKFRITSARTKCWIRFI